MTIFLGGGGEMFCWGFKRERPAGAGSEKSFSCRARCEWRCRGSRESSGGGRASVARSARVSSPAGIAGHGVSGCATDGFRSACAALVSIQEMELEDMNRKTDRDCTLLLPVYRMLYTKLVMIRYCWSLRKCLGLYVVFCRVSVGGGCPSFAFV